MSDQKDPLSQAIEVLNAEPVKNLLSPVTNEIGQMLGVVASCARFYMTENLEKVFTKWAASRRGAVLGDEDYKKIMPLLPAVAMVSDEELQEKWATLLESTATNSKCLPSFGPTLSQLSVEEVQYLDRLWVVVTTPTHLTSFEPGKGSLSYGNLIEYYDPAINTGVSYAEMTLYKDRYSEEQKANFERLQHAKLIIDNLIRVGILSEKQIVEPGRSADFGGVKVALQGSGTKFRSEYSFSPYGISFMRAVTPRVQES